MNRKLLLLLSLGIFFNVNAHADSIVDLAGQLKDKTASYICRKASLFDLKFSIRSFDGAACKIKPIAAIAEIICLGPNYDKYNESHCHKNAITALGGKKPLTALAETALSAAKTLAPAVCVAATAVILPLEPACGVLGGLLAVTKAPAADASDDTDPVEE